MDSRGSGWLLLIIFGAIAAIIMGIVVAVEYPKWKAMALPPRATALEEVLEGKVDGQYIELGGFTFGDAYYVSTKKNRWEFVRLPLILPGKPPTAFEAVLAINFVHNEDELRQYARQEPIRGICSNGPSWLGTEGAKKLREAYPATQSDSVYSIEAVRERPSGTMLALCGAGCAITLILTLLGALMYWRSFRPRPQDEDTTGLLQLAPATRQSLGESSGIVFGTGSRGHKSSIFACILLMVLFGGFWVGFYFLVPLGPWLGLSLVFGPLTLLPGWGLIYQIRKLKWRVEVFDHGLLIDRAGDVTPLPWSHIRDFREVVIFTNGVQTDHQVNLELHDGRWLRFDGAYRDVATLARLMREASYEDRLAYARRRLQDGREMRFGRLSLSARGLTAGGETLPWAEVDGVLLEDGKPASNVVVRKRGRRGAWFTMSVPYFPNTDVFYTLASECLGQRPTG